MSQAPNHPYAWMLGQDDGPGLEWCSVCERLSDMMACPFCGDETVNQHPQTGDGGFHAVAEDGEQPAPTEGRSGGCRGVEAADARPVVQRDR